MLSVLIDCIRIQDGLSLPVSAEYCLPQPDAPGAIYCISIPTARGLYQQRSTAMASVKKNGPDTQEDTGRHRKTQGETARHTARPEAKQGNFEGKCPTNR